MIEANLPPPETADSNVNVIHKDTFTVTGRLVRSQMSAYHGVAEFACRINHQRGTVCFVQVRKAREGCKQGGK